MRASWLGSLAVTRVRRRRSVSGWEAAAVLAAGQPADSL